MPVLLCMFGPILLAIVLVAALVVVGWISVMQWRESRRIRRMNRALRNHVRHELGEEVGSDKWLERVR